MFHHSIVSAILTTLVQTLSQCRGFSPQAQERASGLTVQRPRIQGNAHTFADITHISYSLQFPSVPQFISVVGEIVSDLITRGSTSHDISLFSLARAADGSLVREGCGSGAGKKAVKSKL